ncbi:MAG: hypothetical protein NC905_02535 [Candidatus Omnitrophica bacterium]|nr:hypothetical protein [Candidatus Omnitrophota bacterium]
MKMDTSINAYNIHYKILNEKIKILIREGYEEITVQGVCGQRYIGGGLQSKKVKIILYGVPGNDLAVFMDGPEIVVMGNAQDGVGNTMNSGRIVIHGNAGDIVGHSMRGGEIFVKGDVGYRVGIHMKEYRDMYPVMVIGGSARNFLGEYMAGGMIILLGMTERKYVGNYIGTGMHGGVIYIRESLLRSASLGKEVNIFMADTSDMDKIRPYLRRFASYYGFTENKVLKGQFYKIIPITSRPYGKIYTY